MQKAEECICERSEEFAFLLILEFRPLFRNIDDVEKGMNLNVLKLVLSVVIALSFNAQAQEICYDTSVESLHAVTMYA